MNHLILQPLPAHCPLDQVSRQFSFRSGVDRRSTLYSPLLAGFRRWISTPLTRLSVYPPCHVEKSHFRRGRVHSTLSTSRSCRFLFFRRGWVYIHPATSKMRIFDVAGYTQPRRFSKLRTGMRDPVSLHRFSHSVRFSTWQGGSTPNPVVSRISSASHAIDLILIT